MVKMNITNVFIHHLVHVYLYRMMETKSTEKTIFFGLPSLRELRDYQRAKQKCSTRSFLEFNPNLNPFFFLFFFGLKVTF